MAFTWYHLLWRRCKQDALFVTRRERVETKQSDWEIFTEELAGKTQRKSVIKDSSIFHLISLAP